MHRQCLYHPSGEIKRVYADESGKWLKNGWYDTPDAFPKEDEGDIFSTSNFETKSELEEYARTFGVELDRRKSLANMLKDFKDAVK